MTQVPGYNIRIRTRDGGQHRWVGKIVPFEGRTVLHVFGSSAWRRRDIDAWGLTAGILDLAHDFDLEDIYLYVKDQDHTLSTDIAWFDAYGTPGIRWEWGRTINLPHMFWEPLPGRIATAWVPQDDAHAIDAPWVEPAEEAATQPTATQEAHEEDALQGVLV